MHCFSKKTNITSIYSRSSASIVCRPTRGKESGDNEGCGVISYGDCPRDPRAREGGREEVREVSARSIETLNEVKSSRGESPRCDSDPGSKAQGGREGKHACG